MKNKNDIKLKKQIKQQKKKAKYQNEIKRKPKLGKEIGYVGIRTGIVLILILYFFTINAMDSYTNLIESLYSDSFDKIHNLENLVASADLLDSYDYEFIGNQLYSKETDPEKRVAEEELMNSVAFKCNIPNTYDERTIFDSIFSLYNNLFPSNIRNHENLTYKVILDLDGNELFKSNEELFVAAREKKEENIKRKTAFQRLDVAAIEKVYPGRVKELYSKIDGYYVPGVAAYSYVECLINRIYVKDGYFIPEKIYVYSFGIDESIPTFDELENTGATKNKYNIIATYDFSECDFTGYECFEKNDNYEEKSFLGPLFIGAPENNINREFYENNVSVRVNEFLPEVIGENSGYYNEEVSAGYKWSKVLCGTIADGKYALIIAGDYNFFRDWKPILILFYSLIFIICGIVTWVMARFRYNKKNALYELYAYRKKTTDAMAHDLKSPLMAISGYAENLVNNPVSEKNVDYARNIMESVNYMNGMIANILELSKLEDTSIRLDKTDVDIKELIEKCIEKFNGKIKEKNLSVLIEGKCELLADANYMERVFDNLISNAVKYSSNNTEIKIELSDKKIIFSNFFENKITNDAQELIQPFVKGDNSRSNSEGNGLGLGIAENIVRMHGFEMKLDVTNDNIFKVILNV